MFNLLDRYTFTARVAPVVIVALAVPLAVGAWIPLSDWPVKMFGIATVLAIAGFAVSFLARDAGKALQGPLWASWGGPPTVQLLRHRNAIISAGSKAGLHQHLVALRIVDRLPSPAEEADDPFAADDKYLTCSDWLRRKALELKAKSPFDVVHGENINYGFRRNLLGIRKYGLMLIIPSFLVAGAAAFYGRHPAAELSGIAVLAAYLIFGINEAAVRRSAFDYSQRLLDSAFSLTPQAAKATRHRGTVKRDSAPVTHA